MTAITRNANRGLADVALFELGQAYRGDKPEDQYLSAAGVRAAGVLVKDFSGGHPLMDNCLRLTIGTPRENRAMIDALRAALGA